MSEQPEALRLADGLQKKWWRWTDNSTDELKASAELRRLHALCEEIAEIAHNGGLVGMSESDALRAIRKITLPYWRQSK